MKDVYAVKVLVGGEERVLTVSARTRRGAENRARKLADKYYPGETVEVIESVLRLKQQQLGGGV